MMNTTKIALGVAVMGLSACDFEGTRAYQGPDDFVAVATDLGRDAGSDADDTAAIATTPDGCQQWLIDDGVEGRASNRLDPVSGLPVCGSPPNLVFGNYQTQSSGVRDRVPREPAVLDEQEYTVR